MVDIAKAITFITAATLSIYLLYAVRMLWLARDINAWSRMGTAIALSVLLWADAAFPLRLYYILPRWASVLWLSAHLLLAVIYAARMYARITGYHREDRVSRFLYMIEQVEISL